MLSRPVEMDEYLVFDTDPVTLKKEAPEEFKELARKQNKSCLKYGGKVHYLIEGDDNATSTR